MEKIRALIVDDEKPARQRLRDLIARQPEIDVVGEAASGADALQLLRKNDADLLFLDIQMPVFSGFEVIDRIGVGNLPVTIFVTAFDSYAVRAFEANALDYLLKPYSDERFSQCLDRALAHIRTQKREELSGRLIALLEQTKSDRSALAQGGRAASYLERLLIKVSGRVIFLPTKEIDWIEAAGVYVQLHSGARKYLHRTTLAELEAQLDPASFIRIHRSTIINTHCVKELYLHSHGDYIAVLKDGTELKLSRSYRARFESSFGQSL
jgi:two-component system LytT family response regulator